MSSPNPDNYARGCDCNPNTPSVIPDDLWRNIPAPLVFVSHDSIQVSYVPSNTRTSWLNENTEVWLFANKRQQTLKQNNLPLFGGFRHPRDTSKPLTNSNFWGGEGGALVNYTYRTEFPFLVGTAIPDPYQRVTLTDFDPYQFFKIRNLISGDTRQLLRADIPLIGQNEDIITPPAEIKFNKPFFPVFAYGSTFHKNIKTVQFQFRFVIPNPDSSSTKYTRIMGPASEIIKCSPSYKFSRTIAGNAPTITGLRLYV
jgi:hypothetical protein